MGFVRSLCVGMPIAGHAFGSGEPKVPQGLISNHRSVASISRSISGKRPAEVPDGIAGSGWEEIKAPKGRTLPRFHPVRSGGFDTYRRGAPGVVRCRQKGNGTGGYGAGEFEAAGRSYG
jgi:hypothetical protein